MLNVLGANRHNMSHKPKFIYETMEFAKVKYLQDSLGRLRDEVGTLLECIRRHNEQSQRKVGFWSSIRMLMPIIESVAEAVGEKPWEFLERHLDVETPHLAWQMFRHSLTHGDLLRHAKYGTKEVGWGVILMGQGHIVGKGQINLDVFTLYDKLVEYLNTEIAKNDQTIIEVRVGVIYVNPDQYIIDDFKKL